MPKNLTKMLIILGVVFIISAYTGRASPVTAIATLPPTSLSETVPVNTQATFSMIASVDITCTDCHGGVSEMSDPGYAPWVNRPTYSNCFTQALTMSTSSHIDHPTQKVTASADVVSLDNNTHGDGGIFCVACHSSVHASYPTIIAQVNEQPIRLQSQLGPFVECEICHMEKLKEAFWHLGGED